MRLRNTDRYDVVECEEILARHAELVDGVVGSLAAARLQSHLDACASCARYDRIVRRGLELARDMPVVEPSEDFHFRLQHRIFHEQDSAALDRPRSAGGTAAAMAVAAVIALLAWSPLLLSDERSVAASAAAPQPPAFTSGTSSVQASFARPAFAQPAFAQRALAPAAPAAPAPLRAGSAWDPIAPARAYRATLAAFPGPHSPLVVTPPAHSVGR